MCECVKWEFLSLRKLLKFQLCIWSDKYYDVVDFHSLDIAKPPSDPRNEQNYHETKYKRIINISSSIIFGMFHQTLVHFNVAREWCWNVCLCLVMNVRKDFYVLLRSRHAMKPPLWYVHNLLLDAFSFLTFSYQNIIWRFTQNFHIFQTTATCINRTTAAPEHLCLCNILWSGFGFGLLLYVYLRRKWTFVSSPPPQYKYSHQMVILTGSPTPSLRRRVYNMVL